MELVGSGEVHNALGNLSCPANQIACRPCSGPIKEVAYRRQLHNPPFTRLASLVYTHTNYALCQREAERMKRLIIEERDSQGIADLSLIGPAPAFIHRLRGRFRWQLILRGSELAAFLSQIPVPQGWTVDIDPLGLA